jgi:hypothetical protein
MSETQEINKELHRLTLRFEINLLVHLHDALKVKTLKIETFIFYLLAITIFFYVFFIKLVIFSMQRQFYSYKLGIRPIKSFKMRKISK